MSAEAKALEAHLAEGLTTVCRAWRVVRRDGVAFGFTDHDRELRFEELSFKADSGLTAGTLQQTTGLSVDNTEALGVLSDAAITEADIVAGRFDGAEVTAWLVNWADPSARKMLFHGTIGEITNGTGAFRAELRGLTEMLNQPQGRTYHSSCSAVLGDGSCRADLGTPGYRFEGAVEDVEDARVFRFTNMVGFDVGWFERGRATMLSGAGEKLIGLVKNDRFEGQTRVIELWEPFRAVISAGDTLRLEAGCDKQKTTCLLKFNNLLNFRGFPSIPGEDWLMSPPAVTDNRDVPSTRSGFPTDVLDDDK